MKIILKYTGLDSSAALEEFAEEKLGALDKLLSRWQKEPDSVSARVELEKTTKHHNKGEIFRAEVNLAIPGTVLRAEHTDKDIRTAILRTKEKLQREIKKYNAKKTSKDI